MIEPGSPAPRKAALVTGGAKRIGRAVCLALAQAGYTVVIHTYSSRHEAEGLAAEIEAAGLRAAVVTGDLAIHTEVVDVIPRAVALAGPLTLLVNNASEFEPDGVGTLDLARWERHFAVNLRAPVFLAEAFAAQAPDELDASIVNIIDQRVLKPTPRHFSYGVAKAALHAATTMLAQALAPAVRVNAVGPGPTLPSARQSAADFSRQAAALPLERHPSPEDIAAAVLFLAGARNVTGQFVAVDGGQNLSWKTPDTWGIEE